AFPVLILLCLSESFAREIQSQQPLSPAQFPPLFASCLLECLSCTALGKFGACGDQASVSSALVNGYLPEPPRASNIDQPGTPKPAHSTNPLPVLEPLGYISGQSALC
ncbi:hypothetical protein JAAARDRAFT_611174, partial [Jaapia argillacea MUCL 33604]